MERVWLAIGSNILKPLQQMSSALAALTNLPQTQLISCSSYYRSLPLGLKNQPDFLNAVVELNTTLSPEILLDHIQAIEYRQGRVRKKHRFGPRSLDLDILLFGKRVIITDRLKIPHYDMYNRDFMLYPLAELSPDLQLPDGTYLTTRLSQVPTRGLRYVAYSDYNF